MLRNIDWIFIHVAHEAAAINNTLGIMLQLAINERGNEKFIRTNHSFKTNRIELLYETCFILPVSLSSDDLIFRISPVSSSSSKIASSLNKYHTFRYPYFTEI